MTALAPLPIADLLRRHGLRPRKSLGQNFLIDEGALGRIVTAAALTTSDSVLEIGPGLGSLTRHLAIAARDVVAVELDQTLLPALTEVVAPHPNVRVIHGDILALDPAVLVADADYKVVANIPYYITSAVIRHLLEARRRPTVIVLTIQREVAERLSAAPGDLSLLAVSVQAYARAEVVARIPAGAFYPRPDVDSSVVRLTALPQPVFGELDAERFFRVVKAGFSQKRKQLRNALSAGLSRPAQAVDAWLNAAGVDPKRRAETLTLAEWTTLTRLEGK
ncbi:MAG TPA: 16S rRNA (adenine(1518)-N(6)/adenine(1519)-N(6))-dimethyltransferase RsmA [Anaerolineales bacterium]|nr:16S rRNA (adenine(1518)-N(6)/adenine(1519)-N(6))-dimethyltransferase RsmA [Anaerolineales bacterium]HRF50222.1 16S rRNA (adenine(1518)-N(6)/adenine(1519)-N(6))-dimethyltransferase RsmA [Anaerolineales bacterium]